MQVLSARDVKGGADDPMPNNPGFHPLSSPFQADACLLTLGSFYVVNKTVAADLRSASDMYSRSRRPIDVYQVKADELNGADASCRLFATWYFTFEGVSTWPARARGKTPA